MSKEKPFKTDKLMDTRGVEMPVGSTGKERNETVLLTVILQVCIEVDVFKT